MFTIKRMRKDGYDAMPCRSYRVINAEDAVYVCLFEVDVACESRLLVETVVYVENADGKTVDRIYGKTESIAAPIGPNKATY
jgi:hypothetical protein